VVQEVVGVTHRCLTLRNTRFAFPNSVTNRVRVGRSASARRSSTGRVKGVNRMGLFTSSRTRRGRVEGICDSLGWSVDERHGDTIGLHFRGDEVTPKRAVYVCESEGGTAITFAVPTRTEISEYQMPDDLMPAMMFRNDQVGLGAWAAKEVRGTVTLILQYVAFAAGVDSTSFQTIINLMLREVAEVEATLERRGLL
jgi:hypothetical protein